MANKVNTEPEPLRPYGRGMLVGMMIGIGSVLVWAPRFTTLPSYAGFLGLGLFAVACVFALHDRWMAEADPQWVADSQQQKGD